jgi:hypothetical protein
MVNVASVAPALSNALCPLTVVDKPQKTPSLSLLRPSSDTNDQKCLILTVRPNANFRMPKELNALFFSGVFEVPIQPMAEGVA